MGSITIYDSEGHRIDEGQRGSSKREEIKDWFLSRLRLLVDVQRRESTLVCFFRARESTSSRAEQYYAVYKTSSQHSLFRDFVRDLTNTVEERWDMELDTKSDDTEAFRLLTQVSGKSRETHAGSEFDHDVARDRLEKGQNLVFGVSDVRTAVGLAKSYATGGSHLTVGIAEEAQSSVKNRADLLFVPDRKYKGMEPIEETASVMESGREALGDQRIEQNVRAIRDIVQELHQQTNLTDDQIRRRVYRNVPTLRDPESSPVTERATSSGESDIPLKPVATALLVAIAVVVVSLGVLFFLGVLSPGSDAGGSSLDENIVTSSNVSVDASVLDGNESLTLSLNSTEKNDSERTTLRANKTSHSFGDLPRGKHTLSTPGSRNFTGAFDRERSEIVIKRGNESSGQFYVLAGLGVLKEAQSSEDPHTVYTVDSIGTVILNRTDGSNGNHSFSDYTEFDGVHRFQIEPSDLDADLNGNWTVESGSDGREIGAFNASS